MTFRTLLLNADYTPLRFISEEDAITFLYTRTAEVISGFDDSPSNWDVVYRSPTTSIQLPATMRLVKRVSPKSKRLPRFRRRAVFNRDNWTCQFCGEALTKPMATIDHVFPQSRGGKTSWDNCVTACKPCNKHKGAKTPEEANMRLRSKPGIPNQVHFWMSSLGTSWHPDWSMFLSFKTVLNA